MKPYEITSRTKYIVEVKYISGKTVEFGETNEKSASELAHDLLDSGKSNITGVRLFHKSETEKVLISVIK